MLYCDLQRSRGNSEAKNAAPAHFTVNRNLTGMRFDNPFRDRQSEPRTFAVPRLPRPADSCKFGEDLRLLFRGNTDARVRDGD